MSVLNYAPSINSYIKDTTNTTVYDKYIGASNPSIVFTGDKHIITHGVDLLADYHYDDTGIRGLVPSYEGSDNVIFTKEGWKVLTTSYLPMLKDNTSLSEGTLMDAKQIADYVQKEIGDGFSANDAMVFKGGVEKAEDLPSTYEAGYTYRATASFTLNDELVEIGDLVIAKGDSTSENPGWFVVQTNINGTSKITLNGTELRVYSNGGSDLSFYAPTTLGSPGSILISGESSLQWKAPSAITVGTANVAKKVENALTIGTGLLFTAGTLYDGSTARTLNLKPATTSTLGGVIIDDGTREGLTVKTPTISIKDGKIYLTSDNIKNALGFAPGNPEATTYQLFVGSDTSTNDVLNTVNPYIHLSGPTKDTINLTGLNGIEIKSDSSIGSKINFSLLKATTTTLGGIKTGYSSNDTNRNYAVNVDDSGNAYVNVPWTDTNNTWREIRIGDISIGNSILNIVPSSDIIMSYENEKIGDITDGVADISFKLGIFNLSTGDYEYID